MIRPDGSLSHNHIINNFSSNDVVLSDNDIVVNGMSDIRSDNGLEYEQVPLIVHLMGKKVLGLTIDVSKTEGHFASPNEMFGTLISGVGINSSNSTSATTTMNHEESSTPNESLNKASMALMKH
jgi:biotin-(acetyl-CoA carboxylase) ligase